MTETRTPGSPILDLRQISMAFPTPSGEPLTVLASVDLTIRSGEILGLLGRSGAGKSTLLRIAAGLIIPTSGEVFYRGARLNAPSNGIAVVFQTFALFPWLTVLENVMMSLDALGIPSDRARTRALSAIDTIGLSGFEAAYPRELSGGMRQRVGFARALVIDPAALLMDEPFSALDVLTAESLRADFIDLWLTQPCPIQSVLLVTHNIEEAVALCDRILIIASKPGHIGAEIPVTLAHPRNRLDPRFREIVDTIYSILTARTAQALESTKASGMAQPLPAASIDSLEGLLERIAAPPLNGTAKVSALANPLIPHVDNVFAAGEAVHILEFAELTDDKLQITTSGNLFVKGDLAERKRIFKEHLVDFVPLAAHIAQVLQERESHRAPRERFQSELEDHLSSADAETTLKTVIDWSRYAELFFYDDSTRTFALSAAALGSA